ncbi:hypothetical protein [Tabrizicola oligotrophica]|uniref:Uncharacterized protein n=1 Tax=Tabrizicola oligotrophica TaxID=2710650 RepID=A0A6M0QX34_9RHOB|nr:hypothetical protein [Tabrizicola oligotrophica]NEY92019.1 hypothetical protein [Tabrizicola oligotrophica]
MSDETIPAAPTDEQAFLRVRPLPEGLEKIEPIPGAVNVRFLDCAASWPEGYKVHRTAGSKREGYARKRDIYLYLQASQAYEARDCGCAGKVAPWEPVEAIYAGLQHEFGEVTQAQTATYASAAARLIDAVEMMCQGRF